MLPPKKFCIPVLPTRVNGKLLFGLCKSWIEKKCQLAEIRRKIDPPLVRWSQMNWKSAWKGLQDNLNVRSLAFWNYFSVQSTDENWGHFHRLCKHFPQGKTSVWPDWCKSNKDKMKYIHDYFLKGSILLEYDKIIFKPGIRALANFMLNSFGGKLWKRLYLPKTQYITEPVNYFDLLTSDEQNFLDVGLVNDEMMQIQWVNNDEFMQNTGRTNVIIAAYTIAQDWLKLYSYLEKLDRRILYADIDSIVFTTKPGE